MDHQFKSWALMVVQVANALKPVAGDELQAATDAKNNDWVSAQDDISQAQSDLNNAISTFNNGAPPPDAVKWMDDQLVEGIQDYRTALRDYATGFADQDVGSLQDGVSWEKKGNSLMSAVAIEAKLIADLGRAAMK